MDVSSGDRLLKLRRELSQANVALYGVLAYTLYIANLFGTKNGVFF